MDFMLIVAIAAVGITVLMAVGMVKAKFFGKSKSASGNG